MGLGRSLKADSYLDTNMYSVQAQMQVQAHPTMLSEQAGDCQNSVKVPPPATFHQITINKCLATELCQTLWPDTFWGQPSSMYLKTF